MKRALQRFLPAALTLLFAATLTANNIQVSNTKLTGQNTDQGYTLVQFDLSWENSWRNDISGDGNAVPYNWDAAWVFVKYRVETGDWQHAWLNDAGHSSGAGTGATIDAGLRTPGTAFHATDNPGIGAFIYHSANGTGTFSIANAQLRWNYGANGVPNDAVVDVRVFAIEMVYVPQGAFFVGSGGDEDGRFYQANNTSQPFQITSEGAITTASSGAGNLWGDGGTSGDNAVAPSDGSVIPADFPKGYAAFYMMKYSITQQQYVDFLNTLTSAQAGNRYSSDNTGYRYGITVAGGVYSTTNPFVACNFLSWMDGAAYMDWAGLRPMTELEYEKACRGTATPVANEYAWGTTGLMQVTGINNSGAANETASNSGNGLSVHGNHSSVQGPLRVGALATSSTTTRASSGASYYGIMELSGNLWERPVTVGNVAGRAFTGVHGDGELSANGHANETDWPGLTGSPGEVTDATGSGFRGGDWVDYATHMRVSDRRAAAETSIIRFGTLGFRGVRVP